MALTLSTILAGFIGYRVGLQTRWSWWHGPTAAVIAIPLACLLGFSQTHSVTSLLCLASGFLAAKCAS